MHHVRTVIYFFVNYYGRRLRPLEEGDDSHHALLDTNVFLLDLIVQHVIFQQALCLLLLSHCHH